MKSKSYLFAMFCVASAMFVGLAIPGCSDDDGACYCVLSFTTINDTPVDQVGELDITDDRNSTMAGFQIDVEVAATCLSDGDQVALSGGESDQDAVVSGGVAAFTAYTIPVETLVNLQVSGPQGCVPATHGLRVIDHSRVCRFVEYQTGESVSCSVNDSNAAEPGLQLDLTIACTDVADGQSVTLYRAGQEVETQVLGTGVARFEDVFVIGGGTVCSGPVLMEAVVDTGGGTELVPLTLNAECCDSPGCEIFGYSPSDPLQGMYFANTFNAATDADAFTAGMQTQVGIETDSSRVWRVGVRVTDLEDNTTEEFYEDNITADQTWVGVTSLVDLPEGQVLVEPLCVLNNQVDPFGYPDQREFVYVDTIPPECPVDLACEVGNPRVAELNCTWTVSDDPDATPDIERWEVRYTTDFTSSAQCTSAALQAQWNSLDSLTPAAPSGNYLDPIAHMFDNLKNGLDYCIGTKPVDYADNRAECIATIWEDTIDVRQAHIVQCAQQPCGFGSALAGADVNCDGYKDLVVGARAVEVGGRSGYNDGEAYIFFGGQNGIPNNAQPDVIITPSQPDGAFGWAMTGLGNFSGHTNDCQDIAISAYTRNNGDVNCPYGTGNQTCDSGAVYIFKGRTSWPGQIADEDADAIVYYNATGRYGLDMFGSDVVTAGDFDNDGRPDLAIGCPYGGDWGAVFIMKGQDIPYANPNPMVLNAPADMDVMLLGASDMSVFTSIEYIGITLSPAGDLDGDGYDDVLVGAPGHAPPNPKPDGKAYILFGGPAMFGQEVVDVKTSGDDRVTRVVEDDDGNIPAVDMESLGTAVAGLGDIDGDGTLDIAISDPGYNNTSGATPLVDAGAVFIFFGDDVNFRGTDNVIEVDQAGIWVRSSQASGDRLGIEVAFSVEVPGRMLGDFDGDGLPDIFIGTEQFGMHDGSVFFLYSSSSLSPINQWVNAVDIASFWLTPPAPCGRWGAIIRYLGDTNGDGYIDVAVGDDYYPYFCSAPDPNNFIGRLTVLY